MLFPNAGVEVNPAYLMLLGFMVGTLSGFFGVGGGFLVTGGLLVFGVPPLFAVGTGLTLILGSSLINTLKHRKVGNVDFKLGAILAVGTIPGVVLAERFNSLLEVWGVAAPAIRSIYVILLAGLGSFVLYDYVKTRRKDRSQDPQVSTAGLAQRVRSLKIPPHSIRLPGGISLPTYVSLPTSRVDRISVWIPIVIGLGVGFLAGLLGAGGGFILMVVLIFVLGIPTTRAVGTDLFQIVITGSVGTLVYSLSDHVDLLMAVIMLATASIGSQLGVATTRFVDPASIRSLFGATIVTASVAVALRQASESSGIEFLASAGSIMLVGVGGAMCVVIGTMLVVAKGRSPKPAPPQLERKGTNC